MDVSLIHFPHHGPQGLGTGGTYWGDHLEGHGGGRGEEGGVGGRRGWGEDWEGGGGCIDYLCTISCT